MERHIRTAGWRSVLAGMLLLGTGGSAAMGQTWTGPTQGDVDWNTPGYWSGGDVPDTAGALAVISDTLTGNRTITTPSGTLTITRLTWDYMAGATGVDKIKLGGNLFMDDAGSTANRSLYFQITNAGAASNMVLDIGSHTLTMEAGLNAKTLLDSKITLLSSSGGGKVVARGYGDMNTDLVVGAGVTVRTEGIPNLTTRVAGTWDPTSVLQIANANANGDTVSLREGTGGSWGTGPGNLIIGDSTSAWGTRALFQFANPRVQGDVTILGTTTANLYSAIGFRTNREVLVGGNFTDHAQGSLDYFYHTDAGSRGTIVFNGGALTERTLTIGRTGLTKTGFRVGNTAAEKGNVKLGADLTTQDGFTVKAGSRFNLADKTLTTGTFAGENGITLATTFGSDTGTVAVTSAGGLTLNGFTLELTKVGDWTNGSDLVLFTYTGTLSGTPVLTELVAPEGMAHGGLLTDGGTVRLANVSFVIPEPATLGLLSGGLLLALRRHSR